MSDHEIGGGDGSSGMVTMLRPAGTVHRGSTDVHWPAATTSSSAEIDSSRRMRLGHTRRGAKNVACSNPAWGVVLYVA